MFDVITPKHLQVAQCHRHLIEPLTVYLRVWQDDQARNFFCIDQDFLTIVAREDNTNQFIIPYL